MALGVVTLTAVIDGTGRYVTLTATAATMISGTLYRVTDDGYSPVRGAVNVAGAGSIEVVDYDAPQNTALSYVARVTDGTSTRDSGAVSPTGVVDRGGDCLFALDDPTPLLFNIGKIGDLRYSGRQDIVHVIGRADPIVVGDVREYPAGTLTVVTVDAAERATLKQLLQPGSVVGFSPAQPSYGFTEVWYLAVADVTERRLSPLALAPEREFDLEFQRVLPPPAEV